MDELMDLIGADESAAQVTDKIKDLLYAKSGEKVDAFRPHVANSLFNDLEDESDEADETSDESIVDSAEEESEE
jgi:hypothetical protein|tara:strand:- start:504 stop:725 length:222 start_codon:yes stop_codon:yes gene_type:complete